MTLCAGAGDLTGEPLGYVTGVLAVVVHASYLVLIQRSSGGQFGPLTAQYAIATMASPVPEPCCCSHCCCCCCSVCPPIDC